jgi:hypothetical protein
MFLLGHLIIYAFTQAAGDAPTSYVASHLRKAADKPSTNIVESDVMWTATSLYTGGSDTVRRCLVHFWLSNAYLQTIAGLRAFIGLMCMHPHVQKRAQEEIDTVVGGGRLPTLADKPSLPYVDACVKEVLRYWTIAPLGTAVLCGSSIVYVALTLCECRISASCYRGWGLSGLRHPCR